MWIAVNAFDSLGAAIIDSVVLYDQLLAFQVGLEPNAVIAAGGNEPS